MIVHVRFTALST